jgi:integrase
MTTHTPANEADSAPHSTDTRTTTDTTTPPQPQQVVQRHIRPRYRADPLSAEEFARRCARFAPASDRWQAQPMPAVWWQTQASRQEVIDRLLQPPLLGSSARPGTQAYRRRRLGLVWLLDWLEQQPGVTWQERWLASGAEEVGRGWARLPLEYVARVRGHQGWDRPRLQTGLLLVLGGQVIRPTYRFLLQQHFTRVMSHARRVLDPEGFANLEAHSLASGRSAYDTTAALNRLAWIVLHKGGTVADITVGDCLELLAAVKAVHSTGNVHASLFYALLFEAGLLDPQAPSTLHRARLAGQRSVEQLVAGYGIECASVRALLVDYLNARRPDLDYNTLRSLTATLCQLFWRDLERHHPGIASLDLPAEVATAWKERLQTLRYAGAHRNGRQRVGVVPVLLQIRGFYLDIAAWALDDPVRWGSWAAPCPIRANEVSTRKHQRRRKARMDQRTRTLAPVLPVLLATVQQRRTAAQALLEAAKRARPGEAFTHGGHAYVRCGANDSPHVFVNDGDQSKRDLSFEEEDAFWARATVEILRHTGMRVEELLELNHRCFVTYRLPSTGEVVPMLQVVPSKTDKERLLLVSPDLAEVLAEVIGRVRDGKAALPLVSRYDSHEQITSPLLPFLFQRRVGPSHRPITRNFIANALDRALAATGLTDASGNPLRFTPHDFRRIFATEALRGGLPPHIVAKILGHDDINTTLGYGAIYPEDVVAHHRAFIAWRRALRPGEEYRDVTPEEWAEFLGHFELRKVALGICTRDYGTPCHHEHACERCPALRPDPAQRPRLEEIIANLHARLAEAKQHGWAGEVAGLEASLAGAEQKLKQMKRLAARPQGVTMLGTPVFRRAPRSS